MAALPRYPGIRITSDGNTLVSEYVETRITLGGVFYPITSSTQMGEIYEASRAAGKLDVVGNPKIAIEAEGEHAAQGGAIAYSVTGRRTVNFTSGLVNKDYLAQKSLLKKVDGGEVELSDFLAGSYALFKDELAAAAG